MTIKVYPGASNPTHEISLSDGVQTWGLRLDGGPEAIKETPVVGALGALAALQFNGAQARFADFEPGMVHIEQRTWHGGRDLEELADSEGLPVRFYDSLNAWTVTPGRVFPAPQWRFGRGLRDANKHLPGSMKWHPLFGEAGIIAVPFTPQANYAADQAYVWLRRVGSPGDLALELRENTTNTLAEFDSTVGGGSLTVDATAALSGDYGLQVQISDTNPHYGILDGMDNLAAMHFAFRCDISALSMATGDLFYLLWAVGSGPGSIPFGLGLYFNGSDYQVRLLYYEDEGAALVSSFHTISPDAHLFELTWGASSGAGDGWLELRIDNALVDQIDELDNDQHDVDSVRIGAVFDLDAGTSGTLFFDDLRWAEQRGDPWQQMIGFEVYQPGNLLLAATLEAAAISDVVSVFQRIAWPGTQNLSAGTQYHLVISGAADANTGKANHWEVGVDQTHSDSLLADTDGLWRAANLRLYYRIVDVDIKRKLHLFTLRGALYAVDERRDGTASHLYINGARGVITSWSADTLSDSNQTWETDQWVGAWVQIVAGTGAGQQRAITANTATELGVAAWDIPPDTSSEYVIYATEIWQEITPTSGDQIDGVVRAVAVVNGQALFAQGMATNILKMRFNAGATPPAHEFDDDGSNKADLLYPFYHPSGGVQVWRALNNDMTISRAAPANWGTNMSYASSLSVGDDGHPITHLLDFDNQLWVLKADSLWLLVKDGDDDILQRLNFGLDALPEAANGAAAAVCGQGLYFSWGHTLGSYLDAALQDVGPGKSGGLPAERRGVVAALTSAGIDWLLAGIDAGAAGTSSVLLWNGMGWHEVLRAWETGQRVQGLYWQACPGTRPRLWVNVGGELVYLDFPKDTNDPLQDAGFRYQHEAVLVTAAIDMGVTNLSKFLKELSLTSQNLTTGVEVQLDYQVDGEIGSGRWTAAGTFYRAPLDTLLLNLGDVRAIRLRLRLHTDKTTIPPVCRATVLEGFARTPLKYRWELRVRLAGLQAERGGGLDESPDAFMQWLKAAAVSARRVHLRSVWAQMDDVYVVVEPPSLLRQVSNTVSNWWGGTATVMLREA
ncbi:MAG: hypothetical protein JXB38_20410 [Anaerolineales bacterium]|nr:hypothetical protein [Anaerolineales bacterium]